MIHYIKGTVTDIMPGMVIIENHGIGYEINVPDGSAALLAMDNEITLYTAMMVREDDVSLYGFDDRESLQLFYLLQSVSGVGAKAGLAILSVLKPSQLKRAIAVEDVNAITAANGVGKKTAQRIVLELKDKIGDADISLSAAAQAGVVQPGSAKDSAIQALVALGYSKSEALQSLVGVDVEGLSTEEIIRRALRNGR